ncbi:very short patch repair endonuclease [Nocardioides sp. ChNu-99]|nr:very short patch repair endonuclease [Nocardioides sp. ChNu-99]
MSTLARRDTAPEVELRRALHRRGLRFRLQQKVPGNRRRTIDVALTRARIAVYVDGCFWHGCPEHFHLPRSNADWWAWKIANNTARDRDTDAEIEAAGWVVRRYLGARRHGGGRRRGRAAVAGTAGAVSGRGRHADPGRVRRRAATPWGDGPP